MYLTPEEKQLIEDWKYCDKIFKEGKKQKTLKGENKWKPTKKKMQN